MSSIETKTDGTTFTKEMLLVKVFPSREEMGKKAVALLIERIKNPGKKVEKVIFDVELVERGSVKEAM